MWQPISMAQPSAGSLVACCAGDLFAETLQSPTADPEPGPRQSVFASLMESIGLQTLHINTMTTTTNLRTLTKTASLRWGAVWLCMNTSLRTLLTQP